MLPLLRRLFVHDAWANREAASSVRAAGAPPAALRALAHVAGAERLWLARLLGVAPAIAVWPELTVPECEEQFAALAGDWTRYLDGLSEARLGDAIAYVNTKGEPWRSTIGDVLTHVPVHSAYHRGQIASHVRAAGGEPAYTDFIHATRTGRVV